MVPDHPAGIFAAPWGVNAIRPHVYEPNPDVPFHHGPDAPLAPPSGPRMDDFMTSIKEVAVFAWSLAGINGNMAAYGRGNPRGESQPEYLPVLDPYGHYGQPYPGYNPPTNPSSRKVGYFGGSISRIQQRTRGGAYGSLQHRRQEGYLRAQCNTGTGLLGSDRLNSSASTHLANQNIGLYQGLYHQPNNSLREGNMNNSFQPQLTHDEGPTMRPMTDNNHDQNKPLAPDASKPGNGVGRNMYLD